MSDFEFCVGTIALMSLISPLVRNKPHRSGDFGTSITKTTRLSNTALSRASPQLGVGRMSRNPVVYFDISINDRPAGRIGMCGHFRNESVFIIRSIEPP